MRNRGGNVLTHSTLANLKGQLDELESGVVPLGYVN